MSKKALLNPSYRNRIGYHTALLGGMAFIFSAMVALGNNSTKDAIKLRLKEDMQASLQQVLPATIYDNQPLEDILPLKLPKTEEKTLTIYRARMAGKITGVAYQVVSTTGYAGPINIIMGIDNKGKLLGVRVISHTETPGLGDKIEAAKSDWITHFTGLSLKNPPPDKWKVKKDGGVFDQFTGATITPRAVVKAIKHGLVIFQEHQHEILDDSSSTISPTSYLKSINIQRMG